MSKSFDSLHTLNEAFNAQPAWPSDPCSVPLIVPPHSFHPHREECQKIMKGLEDQFTEGTMAGVVRERDYSLVVSPVHPGPKGVCLQVRNVATRLS